MELILNEGTNHFVLPEVQIDYERRVDCLGCTPSRIITCIPMGSSTNLHVPLGLRGGTSKLDNTISMLICQVPQDAHHFSDKPTHLNTPFPSQGMCSIAVPAAIQQPYA